MLDESHIVNPKLNVYYICEVRAFQHYSLKFGFVTAVAEITLLKKENQTLIQEMNRKGMYIY